MPLIKFPDDMFQLREGEVPIYGFDPNIDAGVKYLLSLMGEDEWIDRRSKTATSFYKSLVGEHNTSDKKGHFYQQKDKAAWYLFLGEAINHYPEHYEVIFGAKVIPFLSALGRNIHLAKQIDGFDERAKRMLYEERSQPNGPLFELLVALSYAKDGAKVSFKNERPGIAKTYDFDAIIEGKPWAVECKRLEGGEFVEQERQHMRELWRPNAFHLVNSNRSIIANIRFKVLLEDINEFEFSSMIASFMKSGESNRLLNNEILIGSIGDLDLEPIQKSLKKGYMLHPSPVFNKLLTGSYVRDDSMQVLQKVKHAPNPHLIDAIEQAIVLRWSSTSTEAINKKARDIKRHLSKANKQLPKDKMGIVHIGIDCLNGDTVEQQRYNKICQTIDEFNPEGSNLRIVYCNYFSPEAPPEEVWAIDETSHWVGKGLGYKPLKNSNIVIPEQAVLRDGMHWDGVPNFTFK